MMEPATSKLSPARWCFTKGLRLTFVNEAQWFRPSSDDLQILCSYTDMPNADRSGSTGKCAIWKFESSPSESMIQCLHSCWTGPIRKDNSPNVFPCTISLNANRADSTVQGMVRGDRSISQFVCLPVGPAQFAFSDIV